MEARQRGQDGVERSQVSTHWEWKAWRQAGRRRSSSSGRKLERQTAQSRDWDFGDEERVKMGREEMSLSRSDGSGRSGETGRAGRGEGGADETEEEGGDREREIRRRRRWIEAEAVMTKAMMATIMRRLGAVE